MELLLIFGKLVTTDAAVFDAVCATLEELQSDFGVCQK